MNYPSGASYSKGHFHAFSIENLKSWAMKIFLKNLTAISSGVSIESIFFHPNPSPTK
jgi:hypothetical protein